MTKRALIVDDEADIRELIEITLNRMGIDTLAAGDLAEARSLLASESFDLCLSDMRLPDGEGVELVRHISRDYPGIPVAVITAHANAENAVESLKAGAFDYVSKPVDIQILRRLVDAALKSSQPARTSITEGTSGLVGKSMQITELTRTISKLARSQAPVHIQGESGTGKELVARLIHQSGSRADMPFVPVNCGAIPGELMESEFFGHRKGSFTGAVADKAGMFQAASGGTLFLDEVADLPVAMQVKLLRAIQERAVRPVGAEKEELVDVRIISATHRDLTELVRTQQFRHDLYYRLNVIQVSVPPLRERREDVPLLSQHLLKQIARANGLDSVPSVQPDALAALSEYPFPGNVRELENILERAITLADGNEISLADLQLSRSPISTGTVGNLHTGLQGPVITDSGPTDLNDRIAEVQRREIEEALKKTRYNKTQAAKLLGLSFRQLRYRIKKLGLE